MSTSASWSEGNSQSRLHADETPPLQSLDTRKNQSSDSDELVLALDQTSVHIAAPLSDNAGDHAARFSSKKLRQIGISLPPTQLRLAKKSQLGKIVLAAIGFGG
jgi:hypothetical protein